MITLGKRKFEIKTEECSFTNIIKKPKQEIKIIKTSNAPNSHMGKVIGMVADPTKNNRANKVICLKVSKPPASLPSLSSITNSSSLPTKNVIIPRLQNNNNAINSNIVMKNIVIKSNHNSNSTITNVLPVQKTLVMPSLSSPKSPIPITTVRIKTNTSPLNSITNIVTPIKQEKPCSFDSSPKFPIKKECIIKPLSKNFFLQNISNNDTMTTATSPPSISSPTVDKKKQPIRIISLHNGIIKQEKIDNIEHQKSTTASSFSSLPSSSLPLLSSPPSFSSLSSLQSIQVKKETTHPSIQMKTLTIPKVKPIVVVSPLNYRKPEEESPKATLNLENLTLKSEERQENKEVKEEQQTLFATLEYDEQVGFTVYNFPINSPLHLLKNMLINGNYLTEDTRVVYLVSDQEVSENCTMVELCGSSNFTNVIIKFVFRELDGIFIDIYSVEISPESSYNCEMVTEDQGSTEGVVEGKKRKYMKKKKDRAVNSMCEKTSTGRVQLWQFLLMTLLERQHPDKIEWTSHEGEFKFIDHDEFAKVWGNFKNKRNMSYNNLSRAIRYYYEMGIMNKVKGHQFRYKFTMDIKATTGYSFREMRNLYEMQNFDLSSPEWEQFMVLRDLLSRPICAQTNPLKVAEDDDLDIDVEGEEHESMFNESPLDGGFEDEMSPEDQSSLFNHFEEDQLACSNLTHLLFPSSDDVYMNFSLDDAS